MHENLNAAALQKSLLMKSNQIGSGQAFQLSHSLVNGLGGWNCFQTLVQIIDRMLIGLCHEKTVVLITQFVNQAFPQFIV